MNALFCYLALAHASSTFIVVRSAMVEKMSSGYVMKHDDKKIYLPNDFPGSHASQTNFQQRMSFSRNLSQPWCCWLPSSILGICLGLSAGIHVIWSDGLRHLNHRSLSHIVDKSRWRQAKRSCDTCYLAGWAEGDKPGSAHSYPHRSSAQCDPSWSRAGWKGC